jgi:hypothetical protein
MGNHQREATQRAFVAGLEKVGVTKDPGRHRERVPFDEPIPPSPIRVMDSAAKNARTADIYEVYWAPHTSGKTTARSVILWLARQTFLPGSALKRPSAKTIYDIAWLLISAVLIVFILLLSLLWLGDLTQEACQGLDLKESAANSSCSKKTEGEDNQATAETPVVGEEATIEQDQLTLVVDHFVSSLGDAWEGATGGQLGQIAPSRVFGDAIEVAKRVPLIQALILLAIAYVSAQFFFRLLELRGRKLLKLGWLAIQAAIPIAILLLGWPYWLALGSLAVEIVLLALLRRPLGADVSIMTVELLFFMLLVQLAPPVLVTFMVVAAATYALLRTISTFLSESLGDVQVYTNRNELVTYFTARRDVLATAQQLFKTLQRRNYDSVGIVGHSLGSVVAVDTMYTLSQRDPDLLPKIDSLVTFGSALEKVRYFFSRETDDYSPLALEDLRALDEEISNARDPSDTEGRSAISQRLSALQTAVAVTGRGETEGGEGRAWLNLWYRNDIVANPITTFRTSHLGPVSEDWSDQPTAEWRAAVIGLARQNLLLNVRLGIRLGLPFRWAWPHSDYWRDPRALLLIKDAAIFP